MQFGRTLFFSPSFGGHLFTSKISFFIALSEIQYFVLLIFGCVIITQDPEIIIYNEANAEKHPVVVPLLSLDYHHIGRLSSSLTILHTIFILFFSQYFSCCERSGIIWSDFKLILFYFFILDVSCFVQVSQLAEWSVDFLLLLFYVLPLWFIRDAKQS